MVDPSVLSSFADGIAIDLSSWSTITIACQLQIAMNYVTLRSG
jgi:hypothetical protein